MFEKVRDLLFGAPLEFGRVRHLESLAELDELLAEDAPPAMIFKHSTRCPVSAGALRELVAAAAAHPIDDPVEFVYLDLLQHRDISDAVAERLASPHASPQAILASAGRAVWQATHGQITRASLAQALAERRREA